MAKHSISVTLTVQQLAFLNAMVGVYGNTRSEVMRFIFSSWTTEHITTIGARMDAYKKWVEETKGKL